MGASTPHCRCQCGSGGASIRSSACAAFLIPPTGGMSERILIAEDDEDLAFVLREAVRRQRYERRGRAHRGRCARRAQGRPPYDLILLDVRACPTWTDSTRSRVCRELGAGHADHRDDRSRGTFRHDLFYRLQGVGIVLPPLRERVDDLPLRATHLLERAAQRLTRQPGVLSPEALRCLWTYSGPGNVRDSSTCSRGPWCSPTG